MEMDHSPAYRVWVLGFHPKCQGSDFIREDGQIDKLLEPLTGFNNSYHDIVPITSQSKGFRAIFLKVSQKGWFVLGKRGQSHRIAHEAAMGIILVTRGARKNKRKHTQ